MKKPKKQKIMMVRSDDILDFIEQFADHLVERQLDLQPDWNREALMGVAKKIMEHTKALDLSEVLILHLQMACAHVKTVKEIMQCHSHQVN